MLNILQNQYQPIKSPAISFIVPVYNTMAYLAQCLDSIVCQTIDKEIIIIDDGSTDDGLSIVLDYAKRYPDIRVLHTKNAGLSAARNQGLRLARGDYVYFVDSDDYLGTDRFEEIYQVATQTNADVVKMQRELFLDDNPNCRELWQPVSKTLAENEAMLYHGYGFFVALTHSRWVPCVCWSMYKKDFLLKHELYFIEGLKAEDQIFYTQLLTVDEKLLVLELPIVVYRYRHGRITSISNNQQDLQYVHDLSENIKLLKAWQHQHDFPKEVQAGVAYVIENLEYAIQHRTQSDTTI